MKKILIINAHQYFEGIAEGKLNNTMVEIAKNEFINRGCEVKTTTIEKGYDAQEEVEKHEWADIIITQSPVYWFQSPWIHKKYIDEVLGLASFQQKLCLNDGRSREDASKQYGTGGLMLGKKFMMSLTWNAPREAFGNEDQFLYEGKTLDDTQIGVTSIYKFCGCEILESFACYDVMKNQDIDNDIIKYKAHLENLWS
jgi:modulator of drug activity B